jgi:hypothetical protein
MRTALRDALQATAMNDYRRAQLALSIALALMGGVARAQERPPATCAAEADVSAPRVYLETVVAEVRGNAAEAATRTSALSLTALASDAPAPDSGPIALRGPDVRDARPDPRNPDVASLPGGEPVALYVDALQRLGPTRVLYTPSVLMASGTPVTLRAGDPAGLRLYVQARLREPSLIRLDIEQDVVIDEGAGRPARHAAMRAAVVAADGQPVVLTMRAPRDAGAEAAEPRAIALVVVPHVIRSDSDLRSIFERRMRQRQEALDRYFVFGGPSDARPHRDFAHSRGIVDQIREQLRPAR